MSMNKDQVEGRVKEVKGKIKEVAGNLVGNETMEAKGKIQKTLGEAQAKFGDVKKDLKDAKEEQLTSARIRRERIAPSPGEISCGVLSTRPATGAWRSASTVPMKAAHGRLNFSPSTCGRPRSSLQHGDQRSSDCRDRSRGETFRTKQ